MPSRLLWIECGHHAILRTEEYDTTGQRRYLSFYESFRFVPRVPAETFALPGGVRVQPASRSLRDVPEARAAFAEAGVVGRLPAWLPIGYTLIGCAVSGRAHRAALLRYGDGLKTVSIFEQNDGDVADPEERQEQVRQVMARYGRQAWVRADSPLCITILGDAALPDALGQDLLRALAPENEARLRRGLARDFAGVPVVDRAPLRQRGWGYDQIGALGFYLRAHPAQATAIDAGIRQGQDWPQIASGLHADATRFDRQARRWIAATLANP